MYSLKKRAFSVISALFGFVLSLGAIFAVVLAVIDLLKEESVFPIGDSLTKMGIDLNFTGSTIQWIILVATFVIAIINVLICIKLIKKPMEIDERYPNLGLKKVLFVIFTLALGMIVPMQLFSKDILAGKMFLTYIVLGATVLIVLLQIISMFISVKKKEKKSKAKKNENLDNEAQPCVADSKAIVPEQRAFALEGNAKTMFNSIANDPILDGFENRIREIKHLRDAGLINEQQASAAVENIIEGFLR